MKLHFKMPQGLKQHVTEELLKSKETFKKGELHTSWRHLERAHILRLKRTLILRIGN